MSITVIRKSIPNWERFVEEFSVARFLDQVLGLLYAAMSVPLAYSQPSNAIEYQPFTTEQRVLCDKINFFLEVFDEYSDVFYQEHIEREKGDKNSLFYLSRIWPLALLNALKCCKELENPDNRSSFRHVIIRRLANSKIYWAAHNCQEQPLKREIEDFLLDFARSLRPSHDFYRAIVLSDNMQRFYGLIVREDILPVVQECMREWREYSKDERSLTTLWNEGYWQARAMMLVYYRRTYSVIGDNAELEHDLEEVLGIESKTES